MHCENSYILIFLNTCNALFNIPYPNDDSMLRGWTINNIDYLLSKKFIIIFTCKNKNTSKTIMSFVFRGGGGGGGTCTLPQSPGSTTGHPPPPHGSATGQCTTSSLKTREVNNTIYIFAGPRPSLRFATKVPAKVKRHQFALLFVATN